MKNSTEKTLPVTGRLEDWAVHDLGRHRIATGYVYEDAKKRWPDGTFIRTSAIIAVDEGESIKTLNSFYILGKKLLTTTTNQSK